MCSLFAKFWNYMFMTKYPTHCIRFFSHIPLFFPVSLMISHSHISKTPLIDHDTYVTFIFVQSITIMVA